MPTSVDAGCDGDWEEGWGEGLSPLLSSHSLAQPLHEGFKQAKVS